MTAKEMCKRLSIDYNEQLNKYASEGEKLYRELGLYALDEMRIKRLNEKYGIFKKYFDEVLLAAREIASDEAMVTYVYTLIAIINADENTDILPLPDKQRRDTDFLPLFSLLYFIEDLTSGMERRGLSFDIIADTLSDLETKIDDYLALFGRLGIRIYVKWFLILIRGEILKIGRLQYQIKKLDTPIRAYGKNGDIQILIDGRDMHEKGMCFGSRGQDDEAGKYYADIEEGEGYVIGYAQNKYGECVPEPITLVGYERLVGMGDYVLDLHIPSAESFTPEEVSESLRLATEFYKKYYPEYDFKAFFCMSWLLEGRLEEIIGKQSNITKFQSLFTLFPTACKRSGAYKCLFNTTAARDVCELPENTSMQRAVKKWLASGRYYYDKGGIIPFGAFQSR